MCITSEVSGVEDFRGAEKRNALNNRLMSEHIEDGDQYLPGMK